MTNLIERKKIARLIFPGSIYLGQGYLAALCVGTPGQEELGKKLLVTFLLSLRTLMKVSE